MSKIKKSLVMVQTIVLAMSMLLAGCSGSDKAGPTTEAELPLVNAGKLTVLAGYNFYPMNDWQDGQPSGFEYDLMQAIADDMNLELVYIKPANPFSPDADILSGRIDLATSMFAVDYDSRPVPLLMDEKTGMYLDPTKISYSNPYLEYNLVCLVQDTSTITDITEVGTSVTGVLWYVDTDALSTQLPDATLQIFQDENDALTALQAGLIEALVISEFSTNGQFYNAYPNLKSIGVVTTNELLRIAYNSEKPELGQAVNASLQKIIDDGTYAEIFSRYFDYEPTIPGM